jgi:hypothetical protein
MNTDEPIEGDLVETQDAYKIIGIYKGHSDRQDEGRVIWTATDGLYHSDAELRIIERNGKSLAEEKYLGVIRELASMTEWFEREALPFAVEPVRSMVNYEISANQQLKHVYGLALRAREALAAPLLGENTPPTPTK